MAGFFLRQKFLFILLVFVLSFLPIMPTDLRVKADAATWYADSSAPDGGNGSILSPFNTFHAAYTAATSGDTIDLTGTFDWTDADETGDATTSGYTLTKSLTIQGQGATDTIIQAAPTPNTADRRIFTFATGGTSIILQDLTIRYGYHGGGGQATAISSSSVNLTILRSIISENTSSSTYQSGGGGAITFGGNSNTFVMRNSNVSDNGNMTGYYNYTAGMYIGSSNAANEITNCTFFHNSGAYNGAIYSRGYLTVTNSTFVANRGTVSGTDIHSFAEGRVYVKNSIFADRASGGTSNLVAQSGGDNL